MHHLTEAAGAAPEPRGAALADADRALVSTPIRGKRWLVGIGLILIALNLRAIFSSLSALLPEAMAGTGARPLAASVMTAGPVLCLGLFSFPAARLARRFGAERTILAALATIAIGTALRGIPAVPPLLGGGLMAGAGIAICNVLLPGLVKRDFPDRIAPMTGLYSMSLSGGAALAAALTVPFEHLWGSWTAGLAVWALFAVLAALVWLPQAWPHPRPPATATRVVSLWSDGLAWQVSLFMGLQSMIAYCVFGWLAPILRERGLDAVSAGYVLSISVLGQMIGCLLAPSLGTLGRDQRAISVLLYLVVLAGLGGLFAAPLGGAWVSAAVLGLGQGGLLGIALTIILLRAPDAASAASLSGMAQGVGYTLAASGPFAVGLLRQQAGNFGTVPVFLAILVGFGILTGLGAGRALLVGRNTAET